MSAHEPLDYHRVFTVPQFTIRDLLWLTVVACVVAAAIGRERVMRAKVTGLQGQNASLDYSRSWWTENWRQTSAKLTSEQFHRQAYCEALVECQAELTGLQRKQLSSDWFWSGNADSEYDGPTYPIQRNPSEEEKGSLGKWDAYERIHDHMSAFHGVVQAKSAEEATVVAKQKYGQKITHVVPYHRDGFVPALSDYDLGCYRQ